MSITTVPWEDRLEKAAEWLELRRKNPSLASPYFHPKFASIVSQACRNVELAIIEDSNGIAALFPYQRMRGNIGAPLGHFLSDYHGLICGPNFECDARDLISQCRLVAWDFDHLIISQRCFAPFQDSVELSPQIDLSNGFEIYSKRHSETKSIRIKIRRLERDHGPLRFLAHSFDRKAMQQLIAWKSKQYKRTGFRNVFNYPWCAQVVQEVHRTQDQDFSGMLSLLYAGDRLVAAQFGMRCESVYHCWFPAYDPEMAYYSPGSMLLLKVAEHACSIGITMIDLGKGVSEQKRRLMNASVPVAMGAVELSSWRYARRATHRKLKSVAVCLHLHEPVRAFLRPIRARRDMKLSHI